MFVIWHAFVSWDLQMNTRSLAFGQGTLTGLRWKHPYSLLCVAYHLCVNRHIGTFHSHLPSCPLCYHVGFFLYEGVTAHYQQSRIEIQVPEQALNSQPPAWEVRHITTIDQPSQLSNNRVNIDFLEEHPQKRLTPYIVHRPNPVLMLVWHHNKLEPFYGPQSQYLRVYCVKFHHHLSHYVQLWACVAPTLHKRIFSHIQVVMAYQAFSGLM